jgi:ribosome-associated protein
MSNAPKTDAAPTDDRAIRVDARLTIPSSALTEQFVRASGPGGQNVNKVSSAVELRFDVRGFTGFSETVRLRLMRLAGSRMTKDGVLVIRADRHRTQEMNRADARERLADLVREAIVEPKPRIKTKPTRASKTRRVDEKKRRSTVKSQRRRSGWDE